MPAEPSLDPTLDAHSPDPSPPAKAIAQPPSTVSLVRPQSDTSIEQTTAGASAPRSPLPRVRIPNYEILEEVARGGMGVVYKARHAQLDRTVALKMILTGDFAGPDQIERFKAEARAAAQLEHSGIVPIYEIGEVEGQNFFAMQFVGGGTLSEKLAGGPLAPLVAAGMIQQVSEAVHHAHARGIVHRDLKPGNVLLDETGQPKVTDFGLAKQLEGTRQISLTGDVMGTPPYMAPEQAAGKVREIGPPADIYALGAILYATLTGRPPFQAATMLETLRQVIEQEPVSPRLLNSAVNQDLETICLKCLHKEPARRYATAAELAADLRRFIAGEPILARPVGRTERLIRWCRRNPLAASLAGTVAAAIAAVLVTLSFAYVRISHALENEAAEHARANAATINEREAKNKALSAAASETKAKNQAITANTQAQQARATAEKALAEAEANLAFSRLQLGHQHWRNGDVPEAALLLDQTPLYLRGWEWHYSRRLCSAELFKAPSNGPVAHVSNAVFSADDRWIVVGLDNRVQCFDAQTLQAEKSFSVEPTRPNQVAVSPDGKLLAILLGSGGVRIVNLDSGETAIEIPLVETTLRDRITFSPDSRLLLDPKGGVYEVATGSRTVEPLAKGQDAVWAPSGEWYAVADGDAIYIRSPTGEELRKLSPASAPLAVSPDSQRIARGWHDGAEIISAADGKLLQSYRGTPDNTLDLAFSRDGTRLAVAGSERSVRVWNLDEGSVEILVSREAAVFRGHELRVNSVAFNGDGSRLASTSQEALRLWDPRSDPEVTRWVNSGMKAFDPTGQRIASVDSQNSLVIYDAATRREISRKAAPGKAVCVAYSPDGEFLATGGPAGIAIWDAATLELLLEPAAGATRLVAFHSESGRLASTGDDNKAHLWDLATGEPVASQTMPGKIFRLQFAGPSPQLAVLTSQRIIFWNTDLLDQADVLPAERVFDFDINPQGTMLATVHSYETGVQLWELATKKHVGALPAPDKMGRVAFHPSGARVAASSTNAAPTLQVAVWDVASRQELLSFRERGQLRFVGKLDFSPDGRWLMGQGASITRIWDGQTRPDELVLAGQNAEIRALEFTPDGERLVSGGTDHTLKVWDVHRAKELATLSGPVYHVNSLEIDPGGKWVAASGAPHVHFWDLAGNLLRTWPGDEILVSELALSPDGLTVAVIGGSQTVRIHDAESGRLIRSLEFTTPKHAAIAFLPAAPQLLFLGGDDTSGELRAWNTETGELLYAMPLPASGTAMALAPGGERVALALMDGTVRICDSQTGLELASLAGQPPLGPVAWSPDGRWIAAGGLRREVQVWDAQSGRQIASMRQRTAVWSLAFSPDSRRLAIGTTDGQIRLVPVSWD